MELTTEELLMNTELKQKIKNTEKKLATFRKDRKLHHSVIKTMKGDIGQYYDVVEYHKGNRKRQGFWVIANPREFKKKADNRGSYPRLNENEDEILLFKDWLGECDKSKDYTLKEIMSSMGVLPNINQSLKSELINYLEEHSNLFVTLDGISDTKLRKRIIKDCVNDFEEIISSKSKAVAKKILKYSDVNYRMQYLKLEKRISVNQHTGKRKEELYFEKTVEDNYRLFEENIKSIVGSNRYDTIEKREKKCMELFNCAHMFIAYNFSQADVSRRCFTKEEKSIMTNFLQIKVKENILNNASKREKKRGRNKSREEYISSYDEILENTEEEVIDILGDTLWQGHLVTKDDNSVMLFKRNREYLKLYELLFDLIIKPSHLEEETPHSTHEHRMEYVIKLNKREKSVLDS